jgi:hypothetical protein
MKHYAVKCMGSEGLAPPFLTSEVDGIQWSALRICRSIPGETAPGEPCTGDQLGPRASLDVMEKRKISFLSPSKQIWEYYIKLNNERLLPIAFWFIIHYHPIIISGRSQLLTTTLSELQSGLEKY